MLAASLAPLLSPLVSRAREKYLSQLINWICPYAAGGNIGTDMIAKAKPDGYTIGVGNFAPLAVNHALFKKLAYDPSELLPILLIERGSLVLMVRNESPVQVGEGHRRAEGSADRRGVRAQRSRQPGAAGCGAVQDHVRAGGHVRSSRRQRCRRETIVGTCLARRSLYLMQRHALAAPTITVIG